jgi:hypothetical protein
MTKLLEKIAFVLHPFLRLLFAIALFCGIAVFFVWNRLPPNGVISLILVMLWFFGPCMIVFTFYPSQTEVDPTTTVLIQRKVSHFRQMPKHFQIYVKIFICYWFGFLLFMTITLVIKGLH